MNRKKVIKKEQPPQIEAKTNSKNRLMYGVGIVVLLLLTIVFVFSMREKGSGGNTASIDPYILVSAIKRNDKGYVIIDVRSKKEFDQGHIQTAQSYPMYDALEKWTGGIDTKDQITKAARAIPPNTTVVVYGHFANSALPQLVAQKLQAKGKKAYVLAVGWNEFAHMSNVWIPEAAWRDVDIQKYIQTIQ